MSSTPGAGRESAPPSFDDVYREHFDYVWRSLRRLGTPESHVADAAHDVFVAAHRSLPSLDPSRPVRPWLFAIAARVEAERRRSARERPADLPEAFDAKAAGDADSKALDEAVRVRLLEALRALDPDRRATVILHDLDGVPVADIAAAFGVAEKTIASRLRIGREELAAAFRASAPRG